MNLTFQRWCPFLPRAGTDNKIMSQDIRDIKPPMDIPGHWMWLWVLLAVIFVLAFFTWFVFWFLKQPRQEKEMEVPFIAPWERAYKRLENLRLKNLIERTYLKPFYIELSDIVRRYLEERFLIKAPEMTTEEFLDSLKTSPVLNDVQRQTLKEFLYTCDMVKFAKHESSAFEAQKSFDLVKQLVDQTHGI